MQRRYNDDPNSHHRYESDAKEKRLAKKSAGCYARLSSHGLIAHYHSMAVKETGMQKGVVLFGTTKTDKPKKVFVKEFENSLNKNNSMLDELRDFAAFNIIKKCGGKAPKVKLKGISEDKVYLFSSDATRSVKHPGRKYAYHEFSRNDFTVVDGHIRLAGGAQFKIDKISVARMLILGVILNLADMHDANMGMVLSSEGNAKLCFVDFLVKVKEIDCVKNPEFVCLIRSRYTGDYSLDLRVIEIIGQLDLNDYIKAFEKIEQNFISACQEVKEKISAMSFIGDDRKEYFNKFVLPVWVKNLQLIGRLAQQAKREQLSFRR